MEICNQNVCTGCMACVNACPVHALSAKTDTRGFYLPEMDQKICISCGLCSSICPSNHPLKKGKENPEVYAAWSKNEPLREQSSSGGIFTGLAQWVLGQDGYVFGAILDEQHIVRHICIDDIHDLEWLRGSKYVQSFVGDCYRQAKTLLDAGKSVLFTGTPCQIAGLYSFLRGQEYEQLYTMDIVCHGVPSPKVFAEYIHKREEIEQSAARRISFRYKKPGWTNFSMRIEYENDRIYISECHKDPYLVAFLSNYISRECCYSCPYTSVDRVSDITAADFWSYVSDSWKTRNNEKGISLVLVNTDKGQRIFNEIREDYKIQKRSLREAKRGNRCLSRPYDPAADREAFWKTYSTGHDLLSCAQRYFPKKKRSIRHRIGEEINRYYYLLPAFAKKKMQVYLENRKF